MADESLSKSELMDRIRERRQELMNLLSALGPGEIERPLGDGWSAKVHAAHITAWEESLLALLRGASRPAAMGIPLHIWEAGDENAINAFLAERAQAEPLEAVLQRFQTTHEQLRDRLLSMSPEDLDRPYSYYQPDDLPYTTRAVIGWVLGNTSDHYQEHIGWLRQGLPRA